MGFAQTSSESTEFCRVPKSVDELCATPTGISDGDAKILENLNGFIESLPVIDALGWRNRQLLCHIVDFQQYVGVL